MKSLLPSVVSEHVDTDRLRTHLLHLDRDGEPVVFVHGNVSSALFWQRTWSDGVWARGGEPPT